MKVQEERHVRVVLDDDDDGSGGTVLDFDCASDGAPDTVRWLDRDVSVERLERLAEAARRVRERAGDTRPVCPDHGYYEKVRGPCPRCEERRKATDVESNVKSGAWRSSDP